MATLTAAFVASLPLSAIAAPPDPPSAPPADAPPPSPVTQPRPLEPLRAEYPDGAQGDAVVMLKIVVNADGTVRSASVLQGDEPFASAALRASSSFHFAPATRDGKPIAAAIRAEISFIAPVVEPPPAPVPPPGAAPPPTPGGAPSSPGAPGEAPPPPPPAPIEISVRGDLPPSPGAISMSRAEVRLLPGAFGDPFRAVETLPGVTPLVSGLPYFYVRGAPPGDVGYFLDGIRVPLLYHIGIGPSVVHPGLIDRVDLYPGAYPASFGRFAGGIVSGETKEPAKEWHGEGNVRIFDAGALVEGPFAGGKGSVLVGGRYSYTAGLFSIVQSTVKLQYWDYQARVTYDLTPRDTIGVFAFGSHDYLGARRDSMEPDMGTGGEPRPPPVHPCKNPKDNYRYECDENGNYIYDTFFNVGFHRVDLRYQHRFSDESAIRQSVTLGYDETELQKGSFVHDYMLESRTELTSRLSPGALLRVGTRATLDVNPANLSNGPDDGFDALFSRKRDIAVTAYADAVLQVTPKLEVTPGVHIDVYGESHQGARHESATATAIDPRLSARLTITPNVRMIESMGMASQTPSFILPGPGLNMDLSGGLQRTFQISAGVEADLPQDISGSLVLFRDAFFNLSDALGGSGGGLHVPDNFMQRSLGQSYGMELTLRRRLTRRIGGLLTYTLSRSTRFSGRTSGPSGFDRTHVLNLALAYNIGKNYHLGTRILFYSGFPYYVTDGVKDPYVAGRSLPFMRYDVRFEKRWDITRKAWVSAVVEVMDAFIAKDTLSVDCKSLPCSAQKLPALAIPSIGLEGGF